jgi:hypothetical protein
VPAFSLLCGYENHNDFNNLVSVPLKGREMETIYTIETGGIPAKLNKSEIDILHFIDSWLPTFIRWSVTEISHKCNLFASDTTAAVDMLILHGLLEDDGEDDMMGRMVQVPDIAQEWLRENADTLHSLQLMGDTDLFTEDETASA